MRIAVLGVLGTVALFAWSSRAAAQQSSDYPAGYVVLPKIVVHTTGGPQPVALGGTAVDTIVQITNTNQTDPINVDCAWINANNHCGGCTNGPPPSCGAVCDTTATCSLGLQCLPGWAVRDFGQVTLTPGQPIGFLASTGLPQIPCDLGFPGPGCNGRCSIATAKHCTTDTDCLSGEGTCIAAFGNIPGVPENPFLGELKCVEVDAGDFPVEANDLKIEATIVTTTAGPPTPPLNMVAATTALSYNGIGFQTAGVPAASPVAGDPLCLGSLPPGSTGHACNETYVPCSSVLILDNFFQGASPEFGGVVSTDLTLVPCSEDLSDTTVSASHKVTTQILVYNEFEQRTSTVTSVQCYRSTSLSDIDTQAGPAGDNFSLFAAGVQGTLTGQTLLRGVRGADGILGYGLMGVACEKFSETVGGPVLAADAFNLHEALSGFNAAGDAVYWDTP